MSIYTDNGYNNRMDYLKSLAEDHGVDLKAVVELATILGPGEDFDGLVSMVEDFSWVSELKGGE
jgi:hypothetical protein